MYLWPSFHVVTTHEGDARCAVRPPQSLPLVDEIDLRQCLAVPASRRRAAAIQGVVIGKGRLEGLCRSAAAGASSSPGGVARACPCCRRFLPGEVGDDVREGPATPAAAAAAGGSDRRPSPAPAPAPALAVVPSAPPLAAGDRVREYTVTEAIVQGWLHKKGTGGDWAGRRWWKPRWVTLAVSRCRRLQLGAGCDLKCVFARLLCIRCPTIADSCIFLL